MFKSYAYFHRSFAECGLEEFQFDFVPSAKTYQAMLEKSPIVHVDKVMYKHTMSSGDYKSLLNWSVQVECSHIFRTTVSSLTFHEQF